MRIGELSSATGVSADALRFYERKGLIRSERRRNGYRDYPASTVAFVETIRTAQRLGFTLREVSDLLSTLRDDRMPAERVSALLTSKLDDIRHRIADLVALEGLLRARIEAECALELG